MKVILYMAISANGMIAKNDDNTNWISKIEWNSYSTAVKKAGCLVTGHRTYDILTRQEEFSELKEIRLIVVSKKKFSPLASHHSVADSPKKALEKLDGFSTVIVAGGGMLNTAFIEQNLVDEIFLDIEPIILGHGIPLFRNGQFETTLKLLGQSNLSADEIQLHYKVMK